MLRYLMKRLPGTLGPAKVVLLQIRRVRESGVMMNPDLPRGASMAHILVVDDEQANRQMVVTILRDAGHQVDAASNGAGALAQLETAGCDLLVTDMHMPVMDGVELISQCRELHPGLPVIAISGGNYAGDT